MSTSNYLLAALLIALIALISYLQYRRRISSGRLPSGLPFPEDKDVLSWSQTDFDDLDTCDLCYLMDYVSYKIHEDVENEQAWREAMHKIDEAFEKLYLK